MNKFLLAVHLLTLSAFGSFAGEELVRELVSITKLPQEDKLAWEKKNRESFYVYGRTPWHKIKVGAKARIECLSYKGKLYDDVFEHTVRPTGGLKHFAYLAKNEGKTFVVVDEREEPSFDDIAAEGILLSRNGDLLAYPVRISRDKIVWICNGKELPESESFNGSFVFSPDGKHYAYAVKNTESAEGRLYKDGVLVARHKDSDVGGISFSPDNETLVYALYKDGVRCVVADGKEGPWFKNINKNYPGWEQVFFFSPDGKHFAYGAEKDGKDVLVVDQKIEKTLDEGHIINIIFSPDGLHTALVTNDKANDKWFLLYGGKSLTLQRGSEIRRSFFFNTDASHLAQLEYVEGGAMVLVDAVNGRSFPFIAYIKSFSKNSLQYVILNPGDDALYLVEERISEKPRTPGNTIIETIARRKISDEFLEMQPYGEEALARRFRQILYNESLLGCIPGDEFKIWREMAEKGNPRAQFLVAKYLYYGSNGQHDPRRGGEYLLKAASQGYAPAQALLAFSHENSGYFIPAGGPAQAPAWYDKAAAQGCGLIDYGIGSTYPDVRHAAKRLPPYQAYWISLENGYSALLFSRVPLEKLPEASAKPKDAFFDAPAILLNTYEKDSIWNDDEHPLKILEGLEKIEGTSLVIKGKSLKYEPASLSDAIRLLENPAGKLPVHRIYPPLFGQERVLGQLLALLKAQEELAKSAKPARN